MPATHRNLTEPNILAVQAQSMEWLIATPGMLTKANICARVNDGKRNSKRAVDQHFSFMAQNPRNQEGLCSSKEERASRELGGWLPRLVKWLAQIEYGSITLEIHAGRITRVVRSHVEQARPSQD